MCGRFTSLLSPELLEAIFGVTAPATLAPRYNIAPTQQVAVIRQEAGGRRRLDYLRWGLIPSWARDASSRSHLINARAETVHDRPAFRHAFRSRRCLIPGSGFFEWLAEGGKKHPRYIHMKDDGPMIFAGLWESWRPPEGELVESCTILTTASNSLIRPIHDRMPVILRTGDYDTWLSRDSTREQLTPLLQPYPSDLLACYPVSDLVNNPRNDTPDCLTPVPNRAC